MRKMISPSRWTKRAILLVGGLDLPAATGVSDAKWEPFQIDLLNCDDKFYIQEKARQIAWSWTVSAEAVANAIIDGQSTVFVSINQTESKEKIIYAKRVYENLTVPSNVIIPKMTGSVEEMKFDNGARILSRPSTPLRGLSMFNVVLDEYAHVKNDAEIYEAVIPITTRKGIVRIGSSPMGATGVFWEIMRQELRQYPYTRASTPWWKIKSFTSATPIDAGNMLTEERVRLYGGERLQLIYENMLLDDFQQEYECVYVDEAVSYFPWELIRKNQDETLNCRRLKGADGIEQLCIDMKSDVASGVIESALVGGVDIGRKKHLTEIILVGTVNGRSSVRLMVSLDRIAFDEQEYVLRTIMGRLPVSKLLIDQNGLGMQLAENLQRDTAAEGVDFTNQSKELWATEIKIQLERSAMSIPMDRQLAYQIHSIKKLITQAKNNVYDTERNEKHHADMFWALALAAWAARESYAVPEWGAGMGWTRR